jgi:citrate/tricarballylate utilization protein
LQSLVELVADARANAEGVPRSPARQNRTGSALPLAGAEAEVARVLEICNACRYCEGFCAVFPAMTRRLEFGKADTHYLSNLCHNCGACLHACQYAPPHEFAVNVPRAMAEVRMQTYRDYAWPAALGALYDRAGLTVALVTAAALATCLAAAVAMSGSLVGEPHSGDFYAVFPHDLLALVFGLVFALMALALGMGARRFWSDVSPARDPSAMADAATLPPGLRREAGTEASLDVLRLTYLGGGHGEGCNDADDRFTLWRRRFHQLAFYGFLLCFASTCVATLYHYLLGRQAPYAWTSLPVALGTLGGIGLTIGPVGLFWMSLRRDPAQGDPAQRPMDRGFIALLVLTGVTGLALLAGRDTRAMALLLAIHLGVVMALFLTMPYGKFAHGIFRSAALLKFAIEKRLASRLSLGAD